MKPVVVLGAIVLLAASARAQEPAPVEREVPSPLAAFPWLEGPAMGKLGEVAALAVPEGYVFAASHDTKRIMELFENPVSGTEVGFICPKSFTANETPPADCWFLVFESEEIGYVENADEEELDADAILKALKEGNARGNEERRRRGWTSIELAGWVTPPHYDAATKNLEWATRLRAPDGSETVNHLIRILGRKGVMSVTLVGSPDVVPAAAAPARKLLEGFSYRPGFTYGEYRSGDKVWKYGLTGLIVGGGAVAAVKTGFLAKFFKVIWKVLIGIGLAFAALFRRIFPKQRNVYAYRPERPRSGDAPPPEA